MAQIKTIDMMKNYPSILIDKFNHEEYLKQELEKEKYLLNQLN
jgi:hypothetical protein